MTDDEKAPDPFKRAGQIIRGEIDSEHPSYEEMKAWFQRCPISYLPGLLLQLTQQAVLRKVFKDDDALVRSVQNTIRIANTPLSELRAGEVKS